MKNFKFSKVIDSIFINFLLFLISFAWLRFLIKKIFISFILSIILVSLFNFIKFFLNKTKADKTRISKTLEQDIESYNLTLLSSEPKENLIFFAGLLKEKVQQILEEQNLILYSETVGNGLQKVALCPIYFESELKYEVALKHVYFAIKNKANSILLCCNYCPQKTKLLLEKIDNLKVIVLDKNLVYNNLLKAYNLYPKIIFKFKTNKKLKFKEIINISLEKSRAKKYFFSGLFIFFCSFFVQYNFYYVFMSSLLFLLALICKTNKNNNNKRKLQ